VFWRKLDLTPSTCLPGNDHIKDSDDEDSIEEVMDELKAAMKQQPKPQRKNWMSKIKNMLYPSKSKIKDPVVQVKTRGRPIGSKKKVTVSIYA
jgi:dsDNA-specific endonuclease/ATPase MutS2